MNQKLLNTIKKLGDLRHGRPLDNENHGGYNFCTQPTGIGLK